MRLSKWTTTLSLACCVASAVPVFAQEPPPEQPPPPQQQGGWRRFDQTRQMDPQGPPQQQQQPPQYQQRQPQQAPPQYQQDPSLPPPPQVTIPAGTWISARVNQPLSSNRNHSGDIFSATLTKPIIANGFVVARAGQTIGGRVVEAEKAGRVQGQSRLGIELTELSLVDGQQLPIRTQLSEYHGGTTYSRDGTAIATTTGVGAAIGAGVNGGVGAGVGAAAGLTASVIGVLVSRGRATEVYPEAMLTFRLSAPVTFSTERAAQAFQPVNPEDYERQPTLYRNGDRPGPPVRAYYGRGYGYPYPYAYPYWGPAFGPSFYFRYGGGHGHRRW